MADLVLDDQTTISILGWKFFINFFLVDYYNLIDQHIECFSQRFLRRKNKSVIDPARLTSPVKVLVRSPKCPDTSVEISAGAGGPPWLLDGQLLVF